MSRSFKSTTSRPMSQSAAIAQAQQIAAQQMALQGGGLSLGGSGLGVSRTSTGPLARTRPLSATRTASLTRTGPRRPSARGPPVNVGPEYNFDPVSFGSNDVPAVEEPPTAPLENEYIVNLQQQVYFLELELNLLKKSGGGGGGGGSANSAGGGGLSDANVPDAPLDDVMLSLREKYVRMEADYKRDVEDLKNENAELRSRARMRELEINNLKELHGSLSNETASWKTTAQDHQSTLLDHQLANEQMILKLTNRLAKREQKLEKTLDDLVHLKADHRVALESYAAERAAYTDKWNEREKKMDELNEAFLREKEANLEWAERFRQSDEARLLARVQDLEQIQLAMESALKKAELSQEQAEKNKQAALDSLERIMEENEGLRGAVKAIESEKRAMEAKEARDRASKSFWSTEVASQQAQIDALTDKLNRTTAKYADAKTQRKQLKDELVQSRVYLDELQSRLGEEQDTHAKTRGSEEDLNELTRELKRDLTLKTEELQTLMEKYQSVKSASDAAHQERDRLTVELTELRGQFDVHEALKQLKLHEFVSVAHSNLKVAGAIEDLMVKMKKGDQAKEARERKERHASSASRERERERDRDRGRDSDRDRDRRRDRRDDDLYSDTSSRGVTPRSDRERERERERARQSALVDDSRPSTQESEAFTDDSRPVTASSIAESSFDGI